MKVYVAGSSREVARVRAMHRRLQNAGHTITHDWTKAVEALGGAPELPDGCEETHWREDLAGVGSADAVVVLSPLGGLTTEGTWVELGAAWGLGRPVVLVGDRPWGHRRVVECRVHSDVDVCGALAVLGAASRATGLSAAEMLEEYPKLLADRDELLADRDRLQKLFDDAGQGEHNVLALVDHCQDATIEETRKRYAMGALLDEALGVLDENGYCEIADDIRKRGKDLVAPHMERGLT
jgi:hypothetical protein